jgi:hypothetical protein
MENGNSNLTFKKVSQKRGEVLKVGAETFSGREMPVQGGKCLFREGNAGDALA